jgi:hypothetical protein
MPGNHNINVLKQVIFYCCDRKTLYILLCGIFIFSGLWFSGCSQNESGDQSAPSSEEKADASPALSENIADALQALRMEKKVDAPPEVLERAQRTVDESIGFYTNEWYLLDDNGAPAKIKILDSEITNLQFVKRIDVYDRMVGPRVLDGIKSAYEDYYIFSYRLLTDENDLKGKKLSYIKTDGNGWISFEKTEPSRSDPQAPGDLFLVVRYVDDKITEGSELVRTADFSDAWCGEFVKGRYLDYDAEYTEDTFPVIDEYSFIFPDGEDFLQVGICDRQYALPSYVKETGRERYATDDYADYSTRIYYKGTDTIEHSGEKGDFYIHTNNYNMPDADDALAVVNYMCTDRMWSPKTYRGIAVGSSEKDLLRLYPDNLYHLGKDHAEQGYNEISQRNTDFDYAYFYYPEDRTSRDITFYIKDGTVSFIEMIAAFERRYVYGGENDPGNLVIKPANIKSEFKVETAAEFSGEIELPWEELGMAGYQGEPYTARVSIRLPRVSGDVSNGDAINSNMDLEQYLKTVSQLEAGDYSMLYEGRLAEYSIDYEVHKRNGAAALVINMAYGIVEAGGGRHRIVWYYDCDTGNVLSARQYAKKCGAGEAAIIKQYDGSSEFGFVNSVYEANFYIDEAGKIVILENFDT